MEKRRGLLAFVFLALWGFPALAQGNISCRGRIFLPNGQQLAEVLQITLTADDSRDPSVILWTDSKGWFFLGGLRNNARYSITVESDGRTFATTTEWFFAGRMQFVSIYLRPLTRTEEVPNAPEVSVQQLQHVPTPRARRAYAGAQKALQEDNLELAGAKLEEAVKDDPNFISAHNDLAAVMIAQKRFAEAEVLLQKAVGLDPNAPHLQVNLGIALNHLGRYKEALEPLRKSLQLRPRWVAPKVQLGIALLETGELAAAEPYLQQCTNAAGTEEALSYLYLGKLYAAKGDRQKAIVAWENYLQRDPNSANAANIRSVLERLRNAP